MKIIDIKFQIAAFAVSIALVGCSRESGSSTSQPGESTSAPTNVSGQVGTEVKEAADAIGDAAASKRQEFMAAVEKQLQEMDAKIEQWQGQLAGLKEDSKAQTETALASLRQKRQVLGEKLEGLKSASAEAWQDTKTGFDELMKDFQKSFEDLKSRFS